MNSDLQWNDIWCFSLLPRSHWYKGSKNCAALVLKTEDWSWKNCD